jgi:hypothetical protein
MKCFESISPRGHNNFDRGFRRVQNIHSFVNGTTRSPCLPQSKETIKKIMIYFIEKNRKSLLLAITISIVLFDPQIYSTNQIKKILN